MKIGNGLNKFVCGEVEEILLEFAEASACLVEVIGVYDAVVARCSADEYVGAPVCTGRIAVKERSLVCRDELEHAALGVDLLPDHGCRDVVEYELNVLHELDRIVERNGVDALEYVEFVGTVGLLVCKSVCRVDVA